MTLKRLGRTLIDDSEKLQLLATMLRKTPDIKVTTALRLLGIRKPAQIRRLRDKHRGFRRIIIGKSSSDLNQTYLTQVFDRLKRKIHRDAQIQFQADGIVVFCGRSARTLHIPERPSAFWVKMTFVPRINQFLRDARDQHVMDALEAGRSIEDISVAFNVTPQRVHQIQKRTKKAA